MPRRKGDLLALPGVGPALVEILLHVFDSWEVDDAALVDTGGSGGGSSSGEAGRTDTGSAVAGGGGGVGGDVDGARGCGGDTESERNKNGTGTEEWPVDVT